MFYCTFMHVLYLFVRALPLPPLGWREPAAADGLFGGGLELSETSDGNFASRAAAARNGTAQRQLSHLDSRCTALRCNRAS